MVTTKKSATGLGDEVKVGDRYRTYLRGTWWEYYVLVKEGEEPAYTEVFGQIWVPPIEVFEA